MTRDNGDATFFAAEIWRPALEKFGAVTELTVAAYSEAGIACGPLHPTPLFDFFTRHGFAPDLFEECARRCLAQGGLRPPIVVSSSGLAVVGVSLTLEDKIVGALVAGYGLTDFTNSTAIEQLARHAAVPFAELWALARRSIPVPERRLVLRGELLQVLGDALLRESYRTRQYEAVAAELRNEASAKDEFLAMLSHELRTPLTPILLAAELLKRNSDSQTVDRAADTIHRNAVLQARLVDDLLELNRIVRGKTTLELRTHDLTQLLRSAVEALQEEVRQKHLTLQVDVPNEPVRVRVDDARIVQIFRNVFSNAIKFTPAGGRISAILSREGDYSLVRIRDSGEGITPEFLPFVFEAFEQQERGMHRKHAGLGIGLTLVKRLTEAQGGRVEISSEGPGCGTEVTIALPLAAEHEDVIAPRQTADETRLSGLHILIVDDSEDARVATKALLVELGADAREAKDCAEALDIVSTSEVDVVLCDLLMPGIDGFEFLRRLQLKPRNRRPPVIAVSGLASGADHRRSEAAGFAGHLDKPFDERRLVEGIDLAMGHHVFR